VGRTGLVWIGVVSLALAGCGRQQEASTEPEHPGEQVYMKSCFSCHAAGVAGAPKVGDPEAWGPRAEKGAATLLAATIEGVPPGMPPRGLCIDCTDEQLAQAIDYMIESSRPGLDGPRD
jgi:cytochrome c5